MPQRVVSTRKSVEEQTELSRNSGTIWTAILQADKQQVDEFIRVDETVLLSRGPVGETPLHMCFVYNTPAHNRLAKYLVERSKYPLISKFYKGEEYYGENCLHIAIVNKNFEMVKFLVEQEPSLLQGRATGTFFKRGNPCYYGEYPLFFAACTQQREIFEYLVRKGADFNAVDSNGNNLLHLMVTHNLIDMYDFICTFWRKNSGSIMPDAVPLWKRTNNDNLTPLTLCAYLGKTELFSHLLEKLKEIQWAYGPVSCVLFPLEELDSASYGAEKRKGALQCIVEQENVDLLVLPRMVELLKRKWERFAERIFFQRMITTFIYLITFTLTTIINPTSEDSELKIYRSVGEFLVFSGAVYKGWTELKEIFKEGFFGHFSGSGSMFLENALSFVYCCCIYLVMLLRVFHLHGEEMAIAGAAISGWAYTLFFILGFRRTGPFVVMIYKMFVGDVIRFTMIYIVFLLGFSQAFFVLLNESGPVDFGRRLKESFLITLGNVEFDEYINSQFPTITIILMVTYVVVVGIMLLNLLIAMMGDTFSKISEDADKQWHLEWARIIFSIESEMTPSEKDDIKNKYWTVISGNKYLQVQEVDESYFARS